MRKEKILLEEYVLYGTYSGVELNNSGVIDGDCESIKHELLHFGVSKDDLEFLTKSLSFKNNNGVYIKNKDLDNKCSGYIYKTFSYNQAIDRAVLEFKNELNRIKDF